MNRIARTLMAQTQWGTYRTISGSADSVPSALQDLADAADSASADRAYWRLDNRVVVQGQLVSAAIPCIRVLLAMLMSDISLYSRTRICDLLLQIGTGVTDASEAQIGNDLAGDARDALREAVWMLYGLTCDTEQRVRESALELVVEVDTDTQRRTAILNAIASDHSPLSEFASELLSDE